MENHRSYDRIKANIPIEFTPEGSKTPVRTSLADISLSGCYIETMFTLPVGTKLQVLLTLSRPLLVHAVVVTNTPQVGNGIRFESLGPADEEELRTFIESAAANAQSAP